EARGGGQVLAVGAMADHLLLERAVRTGLPAPGTDRRLDPADGRDIGGGSDAAAFQLAAGENTGIRNLGAARDASVGAGPRRRAAVRIHGIRAGRGRK